MTIVAFVTGSTGFLGRNLIDSLFRDECKIIAMHRQNSKIDDLKALNIDCIAAHIQDAHSIAVAMPENFDAVFHLAAMEKARHEEQWNVNGTKALCEATLTKHAKRFVFVSSVAAYGCSGDVINEDTTRGGKIAPVNYCRTKAAAEVEVRAAIATGLQAVIINPAHIVGPYDKTGWVRIIKMIARISPSSCSFCYGPFVADAIVSAADNGQIGHNYLLQGPEASFLEFVQIASQLLGKKETRKPIPAFILRLVGRFDEFIAYFTKNEPEITYEGALMVSQQTGIQTTKAKDELGYQQLPLANNIAKTIDWLRSTNQI
ncbi:hypothetical protein THRCLA_09017 [Thraustotheca clavata]|uniref:NAD-dependent epimerase/dehydratase domain-containing protein n=1 Tax=Thraustotheca clavata TaxID=74557 RepID=A0A1V9Z0R0_9STRA|nr:hypothetical protein THRCLA_09017 [Thraustotheca clavata]